MKQLAISIHSDPEIKRSVKESPQFTTALLLEAFSRLQEVKPNSLRWSRGKLKWIKFVGNSTGEEVITQKNSFRNLHRGDLEFVAEY